MNVDSNVDSSRRSVMLAAGAAALGSVALIARAQTQPRVIPIVAKKFSFIPESFEVKRGETVLLQFTAPDVAMGFSLPDFKTRVDIVPGKTAELLFTPDKAGKFGFACDVFCGDGHEDMGGTVIVT